MRFETQTGVPPAPGDYLIHIEGQNPISGKYTFNISVKWNEHGFVDNIGCQWRHNIKWWIGPIPDNWSGSK